MLDCEGLLPAFGGPKIGSGLADIDPQLATALSFANNRTSRMLDASTNSCKQRFVKSKTCELQLVAW
jgi:hypothetical protein